MNVINTSRNLKRYAVQAEKKPIFSEGYGLQPVRLWSKTGPALEAAEGRIFPLLATFPQPL
jgi:hypothetical protein